MKRQVVIISFILSVTLLIPAMSRAAVYEIDASHSSVRFKIRHLVSKVTGEFGRFSGMINFDEDNINNSTVKAVIEADSIDTNNTKRDDHLRNKDFFEVETYPEIVFLSERVEAGKLIGNLTLHGVTREVVMDLEQHGVAQDPWGNTRAGFTASTTIDRKEFGIVYNKTMDQGGLLLGEDVAIEIEIEAIRKKENA